MSAAKKTDVTSVENYLAEELVSPIKHEYLGGFVYAMAGASNVHVVIASNILGALHARLRGKPCRALNSDAKVRIRLPNHTRFYYPDALVVCRSNDARESYQDDPAVIVEVLSDATRRIDEGEKKDAYLTISSLSVYILAEQNAARVAVWRRTDQGFVREVSEGMEAVVSLSEFGVELPLAEIYETVEFVTEAIEGE